jgi:hypothetical protein
LPETHRPQIGFVRSSLFFFIILSTISNLFPGHYLHSQIGAKQPTRIEIFAILDEIFFHSATPMTMDKIPEGKTEPKILILELCNQAIPI